MSGRPGRASKPSFTERLSKRFSKRPASTPSPVPISTPAFTPSTAQSLVSSSSQISASSSSQLAGLVVANSPNANAVDPSSQQTTSKPFSSHNLLDDALKRLSDRDRATLREHILRTSSDIDLALEQALVAVKEKQRCCLEKRWRFTFAGREFILKEEADKVVGWLNRFKDVGDVAVNVDPVHAGLPWAGIRLLLQAAVSEANQMTSLLVGCETVLYMGNRLKAYIVFLNGLPATLARTNLESTVTKLYAHILQFLARAIQIYQTPSFQRTLNTFWQDSDVQMFEQECDKLGRDIEIDAGICERALSAQDREHAEKLKQGLERVLEELKKVHIQESLIRLEIKLDLDKLPYAKGAMFNSYDEGYITCHPATRVDLLRQIQDWAQQPHGKSIFWLSGMAGTGKSTISRTFAGWLTERGRLGVVDLGASFFFKRGEGDRGSASRFFSTIARQLALKILGFDTLIAEVITSDPFIFDKSLGEQFNRLIYQPLQKTNQTTSGCSTLIVVVDALDECDKERDIKVILDLWHRLPQITTIHLRLFLTSRPELPIRLGFKNMPADAYQDVMLQDAVPQTTIQHDISVFLKDEFSKIRDVYNRDRPTSSALELDWPNAKTLQTLVVTAVPLFIVAATVCRFVGDPKWNPRTRLKKILEFQGIGTMSQMEQTYLPVLQQMLSTLSDSRDEELLCQLFRLIVGSIVVLAEPLSMSSLADLLNVPQDDIWCHLSSLYSVLRVPADFETPVRTLHLSFSEFLLSDKLQHRPFGVNGPITHQMLLTRCLDLLSGPNGLRENLCDLIHPGQPRREVDLTVIDKRLPPAFQYACRYWVHHVQHSKFQAHDDDRVHVFLKEHFLHWLEALSLMNRFAEVIGHVGVLQSLVSANNSTYLSSFLEDARRIVLAYRYIADFAPLQIYTSAMIFAPQTSIVRNICGRVPAWLQKYPTTLETWSLELQKLEGHTGSVRAVAFSQDGSLLASASIDQTIRLWNPTTGQEVQKLEGQKLEGDTGWVNTVAFSQDGLLLASASNDKTVRLWNLTTGQEALKLQGHTNGVSAVAFSQDGLLLASASNDKTVRLWNLTTGQEVQMLEGHTSGVHAVTFSQDGSLLASASSDKTVRLWHPTTGQEALKLVGHTGWVSAVAFSQDGLLLASASGDETIRLWNPTTGQEVQRLEGHTGWVRAVAFSQDGSLLASASTDQTIRLWNPTTGQEAQKLEGHTESVNAVALSQDGSLLASASSDETVRLWNPATGQGAQTLERHTGWVRVMAFSHDGSLLASTSKDETIRLWNTATGQEVQKLEGHTDSVNAVAFSQDGSLLASASSDETVRLWNPTTGQELQRLEGHTGWVRAVAFSQDGSLLASASNDTTVRLWNPATGQEAQKLEGHTSTVNEVAFSQDGLLLLSASPDKTVRLWNLTTGQEALKLEGHNSKLSVVALSQDSSLLASALSDKTIRLWDLIAGQEAQKLEGHTNWVTAVAFSQDGTLLASASRDKTVRLWNATTGQAVQKFETVSDIESISLTFDNKTLLTNRGAIYVGHESVHASALKSLTNQTHMIDNDWIQRNNYNLLWLPYEYRSDCSAVYGNTFAIGRRSGQVSFIQFDYT